VVETCLKLFINLAKCIYLALRFAHVALDQGGLVDAWAFSAVIKARLVAPEFYQNLLISLRVVILTLYEVGLDPLDHQVIREHELPLYLEKLIILLNFGLFFFIVQVSFDTFRPHFQRFQELDVELLLSLSLPFDLWVDSLSFIQAFLPINFCNFRRNQIQRIIVTNLNE
jgi:hypothetical protein